MGRVQGPALALPASGWPCGCMQGAAHAFQVVESGHTLSAVGKATALMVGIKRGGARSDGSLAGAAVETAVYGYVLLQGAGLLADGSELLLEVVEPGIIGGAAPDPRPLARACHVHGRARLLEGVEPGIIGGPCYAVGAGRLHIRICITMAAVSTSCGGAHAMCPRQAAASSRPGGMG